MSEKKTKKQAKTKVCTKCGKRKKIDEFRLIKNSGKSQRHSSCIDCCRAYDKARWAKKSAQKPPKPSKPPITEKQCADCKQTLPIEQFIECYKTGNQHVRTRCLSCHKKYKQNYYRKNKKRIRKKAMAWNMANKEKIAKTNSAYYHRNKERTRERTKRNWDAKREQYNATQKAWRDKNIERVREIHRLDRRKRRADPAYRMRSLMSSAIGSALRDRGGSKRGQSCMKYLPYDISELMKHIEAQFEPWMNWDNRGRYVASTWDDNDQSTWTWQLDHIIPASTFSFTDMEDAGFQECWALSNLRPYSAKQNVIDGARRDITAPCKPSLPEPAHKTCLPDKRR